jgi:TolB-like protein
MRFVLLALALVAAAAYPVTGGAQDTFDTRPGIAVFPFSNGGSYGPGAADLSALEVGIQQLLLTELAQNPNLRIVERSRLREILDEQGLVSAGQVDSRTAAEIGRLIGARYMITGAYMDLFGTFRLDGRVVDVETGEVIRTQELRDQTQNLYALLVEMAARITAGVDLPPLAGPVSQQRRARAIPAEAVTLYSRAQVFEDMGQPDRAVELYRQISQSFPEMVEATEALRQLTSG